ncbi:hypothetical protein C8R44DRAFT_894899 [Mycena epipterygia]|nr:hypothetical protein C8R44DRAFT_894899 [Mycena epipterygia]
MSVVTICVDTAFVDAPASGVKQHGNPASDEFGLMCARTHSLPADSSYVQVIPASHQDKLREKPGQEGPSVRAALRAAVLGLPDAARLVARVCTERERTGVATLFVFSTLALDVRRPDVACLVHAFLATCRDSASSSNGRNGGYSTSGGMMGGGGAALGGT